MSDLGATLLQAILEFARARLEQFARDVIDDALNDGKALLQPLLDQVPSQAQIDKYNAKKDEIGAHLTAARDHIEAVSTALAAGPTSLDAAKPILDDVAAALAEIDAAVTIVATEIPEVGDARDAVLKLVRKTIGDAGDEVAGLAKELGILADSARLPDGFTLTATGIRFDAANVAARDLASTAGLTLTLSKTTVVGTFDYRTDGKALTVTMTTGAAAAFVSDGMTEMVLPGGAKVDAEVEIGVSSVSGLTLKGGSHQRIPLPGTLAIPGVDLRDLGLALPKPEDVIPAFDLTGTLAGKLGALAATIDDLGLEIRVSPERILAGAAGAGSIVDIAGHPPAGLGLVVDAGIVKGGGYLFHRESLYGGALDLRIGPVEVKAIGFVDTAPFSMVIVLSAEFTPAIQLGFGFTLNGVGGLLAIERTVSSDALIAGLENHSADLILFPKDPVGSARRFSTCCRRSSRHARAASWSGRCSSSAGARRSRSSR